MKEIFDWLREQIYGNNDKAKNFSKDTYVVNKKYVDKIINEAEAKWKEDCCEWKPHDKAKNVLMVHGELHYRHYVSEWKFCPYCGKQIKISEVE